MKTFCYSILFFLFLLITSCQNPTAPSKIPALSIDTFTTKDYQLYLPNNAQQVLVLFPGGGTVAKDIAANFAIVEPAPQQNVALFLMNFNRHLWITPDQCEQLNSILCAAFQEHQLEALPVVLGGMSIGGNVATTLGSYWLQQATKPSLKGVFIVDSPLDLYALYENALFDTKRPELDEQRLAEPNWIVNYFTNSFGTDSTELLTNIQKVAPLTYAQQHWQNIAPLQAISTRFYTEPDPLWWQANRQTQHERTNAHMLQQWTTLLKQQDWQQLELIQTQNKGYRANGERHPHSWSIVEVEELLRWIKKIGGS